MTKEQKKVKEQLLMSAFIDNDKDYKKEVVMDFGDGNTELIATIKHLTQVETLECFEQVGEEALKTSTGAYHYMVLLAEKSIVNWIFEGREITAENIEMLSVGFSELIFKGINDLEEIWLKKLTKTKKTKKTKK